MANRLIDRLLGRTEIAKEKIKIVEPPEDETKTTIEKRTAAILLTQQLNVGKIGIFWSIAGCLITQIVYILNPIGGALFFVIFCVPLFIGLIKVQQKIDYLKTKYQL